MPDRVRARSGFSASLSSSRCSSASISGVIITALPWWTAIWDQNAFLLAHPHLLAVLRLGPVRGVISGLGLIDIWIGISEAVHYRESKPPAKLP